jgi:ribosomal protein L37E
MTTSEKDMTICDRCSNEYPADETAQCAMCGYECCPACWEVVHVEHEECECDQ